MKKSLLFLSALVLSTMMAIPVMAGKWVDEPFLNTDILFSYIKDNGQYAYNEWIKDNNTWYWIGDGIGDAGYIHPFAGIANDGYRYNSYGEYIDMNTDGRKYMTPNLYQQIKKGMSYEQVITILGKEHENYATIPNPEIDKHSHRYITYYGEDMRNFAEINFTDGIVTSMALSWKY